MYLRFAPIGDIESIPIFWIYRYEGRKGTYLRERVLLVLLGLPVAANESSGSWI